MLSILFAIVALIFFSCVWWYATIPTNLPPGPTGLPLIGSMFITWKASNIHRKLCQLTKIYGPVYKFYVADKLVVVLGNWDVIQEALVKQADVYAGRPSTFSYSKKDRSPGNGLIRSEGDHWKIQRRFAISTLRDFGLGRPIIEPMIREETDHLVEAIQSQRGNPFDPATFLNNAVSNVICALVFGQRYEYDDERFHELLASMRSRLSENDVSTLSPFIISQRVASFMALSSKVKKLFDQGAQIVNFVRRQITETMRDFSPQDEPTNYIQAYFKAQKEREATWSFTDDQLVASVRDLFVAGTDTTATTLRWAIFYLAHNPQWQEKMHKEMGTNRSSFDYADRTKLPIVEAVLLEIQRMADLVPLGVTHRTTAPSKLCGYDIPQDTIIAPILTSALRDPQVYPNPHKFDPTRFLNAQKSGEKAAVFTHLIPFSAGKRICLGEPLARMELFLFFTALISNFKFSFPDDEAIPNESEELVSLIRAPPKYNIRAQPRVD